jgi:hypothetical protein
MNNEFENPQSLRVGERRNERDPGFAELNSKSESAAQPPLESINHLFAHRGRSYRLCICIFRCNRAWKRNLLAGLAARNDNVVVRSSEFDRVDASNDFK